MFGSILVMIRSNFEPIYTYINRRHKLEYCTGYSWGTSIDISKARAPGVIATAYFVHDGTKY